MKTSPDSAHYLPVQPISDPEMESFLKALDMEPACAFLRGEGAEERFLSSYRDWLFSQSEWQIKGLEGFAPYMSCGVTHSFHDFYQIHYDKTLAVLKGEYPYHKAFFESVGRACKWADEGLGEKDFLILSWPFAGDGSVSVKARLLRECSLKNIPVLLDCAYYALSAPCFLDLREYPCVQMLSFSASKFFNLGRLRIGLCFSKYQSQGSMAILSPYRYTNRWGAYPAFELLKSFPADYMFKKYRAPQQRLCQEKGLKPSDTVLFGLKTAGQLDFLSRGGDGRVCLSAFLSKKA